MANKFQMSIQERLEQEASRQKTEAKPSPKGSSKKLTEKPVEEAPAKKELEPTLKQEQAGPEKETPMALTRRHEPQPLDIGDYLYPRQQRQAKNKTFYLDEEVVTAIRKVAKEQGTTDSKLVNDILRRVLGVK